MKCITTSVVSGATGISTKGLSKIWKPYVGKHLIYSVQNITLNTESTGVWNLKPELFKRTSTREKKHERGDNNNNNNNIMIGLPYWKHQNEARKNNNVEVQNRAWESRLWPWNARYRKNIDMAMCSVTTGTAHDQEAPEI
jgi:hypothetical protein